MVTTSTQANPTNFSRSVLEAGGWPTTLSNIVFLNSWQAAEGQWGATGRAYAGSSNNPLNIKATTPGQPSWSAPGSNGQLAGPFAIYPSLSSGAAATASLIRMSIPSSFNL